MYIDLQITIIDSCAGAVAKSVEFAGWLQRLGPTIAWYNNQGEYCVKYHGAKPRRPTSLRE
jgi:hypothetical protein